MKNAAMPSNAIPPATDNPMIEPVPSPELSESGGGWSLGVWVGVGEALVLVARTVTTTTVGEPSAPVLWMLLSCWGGGVAWVWGGGVVVGSCLGVEEVSEVVEVVVLVFSFGGLDGCEGVFSCDVDVLVGVGETGGDDCTNDEMGFWRGTNWAS
jgi:hypothetical protein